MTFISGFKAESHMTGNALWFVFHDQKLLIKNENDILTIPELKDLETLKFNPTYPQYMGSLDGRPSFAGELLDGTSVTDPFSFHPLRALFGKLHEELIGIAGLANQLVLWNQNHQYCGKCGVPNRNKVDERAKFCPECGLINYPRLSPAIIVAVTHKDRILLAHSSRFPVKFYSVLAGFVEPGETLEACVKREVREEVGIDVKNIRYFGSQPWPFPDSLMIAFTAEYAGGEISIDESEILDADWFTADNHPPIPPKISIARHLIDWFTEKSRRL
jgi:NAD+ diphosphatase